jgi:serine acetyltransferase
VAYATAARTSRFSEVQAEMREQPMRIFMAFAITMSAAIGLGGCFWHHQQAVVTEPLK